MTRQGNTGKEMLASGQWALVGRKHYQHENGTQIKYDCNAWGWRINGGNEVWKHLWVARHNAEKVSG